MLFLEGNICKPKKEKEKEKNPARSRKNLSCFLHWQWLQCDRAQKFTQHSERLLSLLLGGLFSAIPVVPFLSSCFGESPKAFWTLSSNLRGFRFFGAQCVIRSLGSVSELHRTAVQYPPPCPKGWQLCRGGRCKHSWMNQLIWRPRLLAGGYFSEDSRLDYSIVGLLSTKHPSEEQLGHWEAGVDEGGQEILLPQEWKGSFWVRGEFLLGNRIFFIIRFSQEGKWETRVSFLVGRYQAARDNSWFRSGRRGHPHHQGQMGRLLWTLKLISTQASTLRKFYWDGSVY